MVYLTILAFSIAAGCYAFYVISKKELIEKSGSERNEEWYQERIAFLKNRIKNLIFAYRLFLILGVGLSVLCFLVSL